MRKHLALDRPIQDRGYAICTVCGAKTDRIVDAPCNFCSQPAPVVGMGVTYSCWTDRYVGTVVEVSDSGKTFVMQPDRAIALHKDVHREAQSYRYEPNPKGQRMTFRITSRDGRKAWRSTNYTASVGHRNAYYDPSF